MRTDAGANADRAQPWWTESHYFQGGSQVTSFSFPVAQS